MNTLRLLVAALCLLCVKSETLTQPASVTVQPGHTLSISCTVSYSVSSYWTAYIRQPTGKTLEWIGYHLAGNTLYLKDSLKNQFSINADSSSNTVTLTGQNLQPGDSGVYYCARAYTGDAYFDYWGKGTQVTVTSAEARAPVVFPVMPCNTETSEITLACLATGFTPSTVTFKWSQNGTDLTDSLDYPPVLKNNDYSAVSQIRIRRQDWDEKHPFKCRVDHQGGNKEVNFIKQVVHYELPNDLKIMTTEKDKKITLSCLANNFRPNDYAFKWLKNNQEFADSLQFTTASKGENSVNGTFYTAASFLTLPTNDLRDDTKITCKFNLGKGQKQQTDNNTYQYSPSDRPTRITAGDEDNKITIFPPSLEDMLLYRSGQLRCEVSVKDPSGVLNVFWMNENGKTLMNHTDPGASVSDGHYVLNLDITYEEWNRGIKRVCFLSHRDLINGLQEKFERNYEPNFAVDMIEVYHKWNTEQVQEEDSMQGTAMAFIILFLITLLFGICTTAFKVK